MNLLKHKGKLGKSSIKEGMDNLPCGICFLNKNGMVVLCNKQMYSLCHTLLGRNLQHISELQQALRNPQNGVEAVSADADVLRFPSGKVWKFRKDSITDADGNAYTQLQAIDVTTLYEKESELNLENNRLNEANDRARRLYAALDQIVLEEETLAMKMRVHDDIGRCLLSSRNLLMQGGSLEEYKKSGEHWMRMASLIESSCNVGYVPQTVPNEDILSQLVASAQEIGVHISMQGSLPSSKEDAYLMIVAMRECVTNAVRHANADEMTVVFTETDAAFIAAITNNGKIPIGEIIEGGGLSGLRHRIESKDGRITVENRPVFRLTVTLPRKEEGI